MKKDEKTEKDYTARTSSKEKNSTEGGGEENKGQPISHSGKKTNNSESTPENLSKKNGDFVRISGKNGPGWPQMVPGCVFFVLIQTLPTFWAEQI